MSKANSPQGKVWSGIVQGSPLGNIWTAVSEAGLVAISLWDDEARFTADVQKLTGSVPRYLPDRTADVARQLHEYFRQERHQFDLAVDWSVMTPFQQEALAVVMSIPYGEVRTYGQVATAIGRPKAVRAVGRANATNPVPIVVPCHRVLGSDGRLHGYGAPGGLETKAWLLRLEGSWLL